MDAKTLTRFEDKVLPEPNTGCWLWTGAYLRGGYGSIDNSGPSKLAHRLSYEHYVGPIPTGMQIDHLCRVRACVNPAHLEPVTPAENVKRGILGDPKSNPRALAYRSRTHCPAGHEYSTENTYHHPAGGRVCITCRTEKQKKRNWRARKLQKDAA